MITLNDARKAKRNADALRFGKPDKQAKAQAAVNIILSRNQHIGLLIRNGKIVYYSFQDDLYRESKNINDLI